MSAEKVRVRTPEEPSVEKLESRALMSTPRTSVNKEGDLSEERELRILRNTMTWKEWVLYDFLRYWYAIGTLGLVGLLLAQIAYRYHVRDATGLALLALVGFTMVVLLFYAYRFIWPQGAFTEGWPAGRRLRKAFKRLRWRM
jgi:hypothetical protein